jgi:FKBP-type peptidyl-prolyl cis-trans isomerase SlyD
LHRYKKNLKIKPMVIGKDKKVALVYELRERNAEGKILETVVEANPLTFIYGTGRLLPDFESNINALKAGDEFSFYLSQEQAYGEKREEMIIDVPIEVFEVNGVLDDKICWVGNEVPMVDNSGNQMNGLVSAMNERYVTMDFNHPMAGVELFFKGKVISVSEVSAEELTAMNSSCSGCGSHSESSGCSGSCS